MKMKEVEKSRQTVWILTMLTVMVVLSAYYLVSDPFIVNNTASIEDSSNVTADIVTEEILNNDLVDEIGTNTNDMLIGLKMERSNSRSKQFEQLTTMMQNDLSEEAIAGIHDKIEQLQSVEEAEFVLEKLIVADGYQDAVVLTNENSVDVIIQTEALSNTEAVKIIKMVSERLNIPAVNIHIKTIK